MVSDTARRASLQESYRSVRKPMTNLSAGLILSVGEERATISSCFLRNRTWRWSWVWDLKSERRNERADLSIWASVRLIGADIKAAKVARIRYLTRGRNIEEAHPAG